MQAEVQQNLVKSMRDPVTRAQHKSTPEFDWVQFIVSSYQHAVHGHGHSLHLTQSKLLTSGLGRMPCMFTVW
jgi:hypothetical protein